MVTGYRRQKTLATLHSLIYRKLVKYQFNLTKNHYVCKYITNIQDVGSELEGC